MTPANTVGVDRADLVASTGIVAVIALASISKLEELVKKIFGVQSSITDPGMRGGLKSLATSMMAARFAKGALDNVGKVAGGVGGAVVASRKMNQLRAGTARNLKSADPGSGDATGAAGGTTGPTSQELMDRARAEKANNNMAGYQNYRNMAAGAMKAEKAAIAGAAAGGGSSGGKAKDLSKAYADYDQKMQELKAQRRGLLFKVASGLTESAGALVGGTTGMLAGAAAGEGKEILTYGLAGVGVGDALGSVPAKTAQSVTNIGAEIANINRARADLVKSVENMNADAKNAIAEKRKLQTKYSAARAELDRQMKNFDISDL